MTSTDWEWAIGDSHKNHNERVALLRPIPYEMISSEQGGNSCRAKGGRALSLNISSGGMLILMDQTPAIEQVLKIHVPTPVAIAETPTLAEVRWIRRLPFGKSNGNVMHFVGLRFMF
ncbi:MAG: PilZ domain-containing protein [Nitrospira sp.]|nr:PilZ domain-containing protein [Nitrospira sp.]